MLKKKVIKKVIKGLGKAVKAHTKQAKSNTGPTPSRAATFAPKIKKVMMGGFMGRRMGMR